MQPFSLLSTDHFLGLFTFVVSLEKTHQLPSNRLRAAIRGQIVRKLTLWLTLAATVDPQDSNLLRLVPQVESQGQGLDELADFPQRQFRDPRAGRAELIRPAFAA